MTKDTGHSGAGKQNSGYPFSDPSPRVSEHPQDFDYIRANIPCQWACPAHTNIPGYIFANSNEHFDASYLINRVSNLLPGILGRICSRPCEDACRHGDPDLGESVAICHLKRAAADRREEKVPPEGQVFERTGKTVGVVGAGPAGLAAAHSLAVFGHDVVVYEQLDHAGGMLWYGIPEFRLPSAVIDEEVGFIERLGVEFRYGQRLGEDFTAADLLERHDAAIVSAGCTRPYELGIPGVDLKGLYAGLDFMMRINRGEAPEVGERVIVIGAGFTAFDCARSALRCGSKDVSICILGVEELLTVTREEVLEAKRENIRIESLLRSLEIIGTDTVEGVRFARNRLGGIGERGERITTPIEGSEFVMPADTVITAVGQQPERSFSATGLDRQPVFDGDGRSDIEGLFITGDYLTGAATVIQSIGLARQTATLVDEHLMGRTRRKAVVTIDPGEDTHRQRSWDFIEHQETPLLPTGDRFDGHSAEVELGLTPEQNLEESKRCYLCNLKYEIHIPDCIYCRWCIDQCPRNCIGLVKSVESTGGHLGTAIEWTEHWDEVAGIVIDNERCIRCGICLRICPTQCIYVRLVNMAERMVLEGEVDNGE